MQRDHLSSRISEPLAPRGERRSHRPAPAFRFQPSTGIRAVKWRLWHGRVGRAICDLEQLLVRLKEGEFSSHGFTASGAQLLTYVRLNRGAIVNYGKRYRAGLRVAPLSPSRR